jgi:hypothetical protein
MARVFTTHFSFNHQTYDAIITVISNDGRLNFTIRLMDNELFELLPDGHINYTDKDGFKNIHADNQLTQSLIQSIAVSIDNHLKIQR